MSIVEKRVKSLDGLSASDLEYLLKVCMKDLLDSKVTAMGTRRLTNRRQIARILTRMNCM